MTFVIHFSADQEFDLVRDEHGKVEYNTKVVTFSSVHHLSLHFPSNFGGDDSDETKIYWIGLKGEFTEAQRTGVVNAVYEARPMLKDHKQDTKEENFSTGNFFYPTPICESSDFFQTLPQIDQNTPF